MSDANKVFGVIPKEKYMYFTYMFMLASAAINALLTIFFMLGVSLGSFGTGMFIVGVLGLALALAGLFVKKSEFSELDHAHFKFGAIVYVAFLVAIVMIGGSLYHVVPGLGNIAVVAMSCIAALTLLTGLMAHQAGRIVTKDNFKEEFKLALAKR